MWLSVFSCIYSLGAQEKVRLSLSACRHWFNKTLILNHRPSVCQLSWAIMLITLDYHNIFRSFGITEWCSMYRATRLFLVKSGAIEQRNSCSCAKSVGCIVVNVQVDILLRSLTGATGVDYKYFVLLAWHHKTRPSLPVFIKIIFFSCIYFLYKMWTSNLWNLLTLPILLQGQYFFSEK